MRDKTIEAVFNQQGPDNYDQSNLKFAPITENLHFLMTLLLKDLPSNARVLCVGVGTGADILALADIYPSWSFTGIDPSAAMLEGCRQKLLAKGISNRCELFHGYLDEFSSDRPYDAVLCLLVMHFVKDLNQRQQMYSEMAAHLKQGGLLVCAEISADLSVASFVDQLEHWKALHGIAGASAESLNKIADALRQQLLILPPSKTQSLIEEAGFERAIPFFQSFLIHGWVARMG